MKGQSLTADISGENQMVGTGQRRQMWNEQHSPMDPKLKEKIVQEIPMTTEDTLTLCT